jgi:hypothetical protein
MVSADSTRRGTSRAIRAATTLLAIVLLAIGSAVSVASPVVHAAPQPAAVIADPAPDAPPPFTPQRDGVTVQGGWFGPFQLQSLHSSKCLDMANSTADYAGATQFTCMSGRNTQKWWTWQTNSDCCVAIEYLYNAHSGKCIETWSGHQAGVQLEQGPCNWDASERWWRTGGITSGFWILNNEFSGLCMDVGGSATHNGAAIIQWNCMGNAAQRWALQQF